MKKNLTEMVFILDRSGSMAGLETDTIGGYNSLLEKQKKEEGDAVSETVACMRAERPIDKSWKHKIENYMKKKQK